MLFVTNSNLKLSKNFTLVGILGFEPKSSGPEISVGLYFVNYFTSANLFPGPVCSITSIPFESFEDSQVTNPSVCNFVPNTGLEPVPTCRLILPRHLPTEIIRYLLYYEIIITLTHGLQR
jgi:hypothetical protein